MEVTVEVIFCSLFEFNYAQEYMSVCFCIFRHCSHLITVHSSSLCLHEMCQLLNVLLCLYWLYSVWWLNENIHRIKSLCILHMIVVLIYFCLRLICDCIVRCITQRTFFQITWLWNQKKRIINSSTIHVYCSSWVVSTLHIIQNPPYVHYIVETGSESHR